MPLPCSINMLNAFINLCYLLQRLTDNLSSTMAHNTTIFIAYDEVTFPINYYIMSCNKRITSEI